MAAFVSDVITPVKGTFDAIGMATGEPGLPGKFRWRGREFEVEKVLERWKEYGSCTHGSGERYVRKHGFRVAVVNGPILTLFFQRTFGGSGKRAARWWVSRVEDPESAHEEPGKNVDAHRENDRVEEK